MIFKPKRAVYLFSLVTVMVTLLACKPKPKSKTEALTISEELSVANITPLLASEGHLLLKASCFTCYNPSLSSHDNMSPPLAGIKYKYQRA